jgi:hypothetical protein
VYQYLKVVGEVGSEIHNVNKDFIVQYHTQENVDGCGFYDIVVVTTVDKVVASFYDKDKRDAIFNKMSGLLDDKVISL